MPNDTRSGLKISGNRSDGGMNPPQSPDLNIIEAVWDHLDRERNKRQPTSRESDLLHLFLVFLVIYKAMTDGLRVSAVLRGHKILF